MANFCVYGDPGDGTISAVVATDLSLEAQGNRTKVVLADTHAFFSDEDPTVNYRVNAAGDDVELVE